MNAGIEAIEKIGNQGPAADPVHRRRHRRRLGLHQAQARQVQRRGLPDRLRRCARPRAGSGARGVHEGGRWLPRTMTRPATSRTRLVQRADRRPPGGHEPGQRAAGRGGGRRPRPPGHQGAAAGVGARTPGSTGRTTPSGTVHTVARAPNPATGRAPAQTAGTTRSPGAVTTTAAVLYTGMGGTVATFQETEFAGDGAFQPYTAPATSTRWARTHDRAVDRPGNVSEVEVGGLHRGCSCGRTAHHGLETPPPSPVRGTCPACLDWAWPP
ncbi:hypothetical protein SANTM175S_07873 [Streptomyces antimycoticus]